MPTLARMSRIAAASQESGMKKLIAVLAVTSTLGGCVVVPARPAYYHRPAPVYYYPAPYHYYYGY
ncbi:hypothetical protein ACL598_13790 [Bordetella bronchialis]|uniref:hypothetical protein n=1 Tax=Bordetella bronchialis TaxID=463025 RepID=UPI0012EA7B7F|nr:hypothetical protein [Bordetella bronchialis]